MALEGRYAVGVWGHTIKYAILVMVPAKRNAMYVMGLA